MSAISLFEEKQVRRAWNSSEEKWYFSIKDVVLAPTNFQQLPAAKAKSPLKRS